MATETTQQIVREAPEIEAYKLNLLKESKALAFNEEGRTPLAQQLPGYKVAGFAPAQKTAMDAAINQGIGAFDPYLTAAGQGIAQGADMTVDAAYGLRGASGQYDPTTMSQFMNPYQTMVTQQGLAEMRRQGDIATQGAAAQAVKSGAFGGTREGVQRAETERGLQDVMSQRIMQDYAQNYAQAQKAGIETFEADKQRQLAASQGLGQLGTQMGQLGVAQGALGQAGQSMRQNDINFLYNVGQSQQAMTQQGVDATRATELQKIYAPYQQAAFLSDIYKGAPSSAMQTSAVSQPSASPFQEAAGVGLGALATYAGAKKLFK